MSGGYDELPLQYLGDDRRFDSDDDDTCSSHESEETSEGKTVECKSPGSPQETVSDTNRTEQKDPDEKGETSS